MNHTHTAPSIYTCTYCAWTGRYEQQLVRVYNKGCDWEDSQNYCPSCQQPAESVLVKS